MGEVSGSLRMPMIRHDPHLWLCRCPYYDTLRGSLIPTLSNKGQSWLRCAVHRTLYHEGYPEPHG